MAEPQRKPELRYLPDRTIELEYLDRDHIVVTAKDRGRKHSIEFYTEAYINDLHQKLSSRLDIAYVMCGISIFLAVAVLASR